MLLLRKIVVYGLSAVSCVLNHNSADGWQYDGHTEGITRPMKCATADAVNPTDEGGNSTAGRALGPNGVSDGAERGSLR
jgi:hypothetical protein